MDLGSRTKLINFEPIDISLAPAEPAVERTSAAEEIGPVTEPVGQEMEFVGADWA